MNYFRLQCGLSFVSFHQLLACHMCKARYMDRRHPETMQTHAQGDLKLQFEVVISKKIWPVPDPTLTAVRGRGRGGEGEGLQVYIQHFKEHVYIKGGAISLQYDVFNPESRPVVQYAPCIRPGLLCTQCELDLSSEELQGRLLSGAEVQITLLLQVRSKKSLSMFVTFVVYGYNKDCIGPVLSGMTVSGSQQGSTTKASAAEDIA